MNIKRLRIPIAVVAAMTVILVMVATCLIGSAAVAPEISKTVNTTLSDPTPYYYDVTTGIGSTIVYDIVVSRDVGETYSVRVESATDTFPYPAGTPVTLTPPSLPYILYPGDTVMYQTSHTLTAADVADIGVGETKQIVNRAEVSGVELNPNEEFVGAYAEKTITVEKRESPTPTPPPPPPDVPATSPIGLVALVGLLGIFGAGMIVRRR